MNISICYYENNVISLFKKFYDLLSMRIFSGMKPIINAYNKDNCEGIVFSMPYFII